MSKQTPKNPNVSGERKEETLDVATDPQHALSDGTKEFPDLTSLRAHHGETTYETCSVLLDIPREKHAERGRAFATPRGTDDALRIYRTATMFFQQGAADAIAQVKVSPTFIAAGVWCASQAERAFAAKTAAASDKRTQKKAVAKQSAAASEGARPVRDQLEAAVRGVAGTSDHTLIARIDAAMSPAKSGVADPSPGGSVAALVPIARELLASTSPAIIARRDAYKLTREYVDECAAEATKALTATNKESSPRSPADLALQTVDVDVWDGMALAFMEKVVSAFELANARDPRVPKLRFVSLRSLVERPAKKPADKPKKTGKGGGTPSEPTK